MTDQTEPTIKGVPVANRASAHVETLLALATRGMPDTAGLIAKVEAIKLLHETGIVPLTATDDG